MDIGTHGLASLALVRACWPRAPKEIWLAAAVAGTIADVDLLSVWIGPGQYLAWRGTYTHAILPSLLLTVLAAAAYRSMVTADFRKRFSSATFFSLMLAAQSLHLAMDLCGTMHIALLWPFSARRFAADWIVDVDPWMITVLLAALLLPELLHLVSDEIGARDRKPRGRVGALIGFSLIALYLAVRADFHSGALALMQARAYHGEVPKQVGAFPDSLSPFTWQGIVETERALQRVPVSEGFGGSFDPEDAETLYKPEPSPALDAAEKTAAAQTFVKIAQFPKATVETAPTGTRVEIRNLAYAATGNTTHETLAVIQLDATDRVTSQRIVWAR
jgi:hypothetical protein